MKKYALLTVLSLTAGFLAAQEEPDWLSRRPRSDNYFYGRDFDPTADEVEESGRRELRLQLSSQVSVAARMESADQGKIDAEEKMDAYFDTVRLRTAEVEDATKTRTSITP